MKVYLKHSVLGSDAYADFIDANTKSSTSPLLVYVGGANSKKMYEESMLLERKDQIECIKAARQTATCDFAALILPCHYSLRLGREEGYASFATYFFSELLPKLSLQPSKYTFVGFSAGAHLALLLARAARASAFACMGGVGMVEAFEMGIGVPAGIKCPIKIFVNTDDPCRGYSERFAELLTENGIKYDLVVRPGDHIFHDYKENGSVQDAFQFAASFLRGVG
jgi:surfactin synthase thioesterase subunit